jgi:ketosteroid isomerase-like protein
MKTAILICLGTLLCGCVTDATLQRKEAARKELLATDAAFSHLSETKGPSEAFYQFMATNAITLPAGEQPAFGREVIRDSFSGVNGVLRWHPVEAQVARSADFGYTWGTYEYQSRDTGQSAVRYGKYVTIWTRQTDGSWKAVLDCGNQNPKPNQTGASTRQ